MAKNNILINSYSIIHNCKGPILETIWSRISSIRKTKKSSTKRPSGCIMIQWGDKWTTRTKWLRRQRMNWVRSFLFMRVWLRTRNQWRSSKDDKQREMKSIWPIMFHSRIDNLRSYKRKKTKLRSSKPRRLKETTRKTQRTSMLNSNQIVIIQKRLLNIW